jgi:uncharacterized protein YebE (UPF0316 family)
VPHVGVTDVGSGVTELARPGSDGDRQYIVAFFIRMPRPRLYHTISELKAANRAKSLKSYNK